MKELLINNRTVYVNNDGTIFNSRNKKLKQYNDRGYLKVSIGKVFYVHRIVCEAYHGIPTTKLDVNHINGIKNDNSPSNLEWVTRSENQIHAYRILKRKHPKAQLGKNGAQHHRSKKVIQINDNGRFYHDSIRDAAKFVGVTHAAIMNVLKGKRKLCKQSKWEYA